jgi:16S rRNA (guanine527-N7)-methyltransferase
LSEYLIPLVRIGGGMLAQKGESGPAEAQSAEEAMKLLGGKLKQLIRVNLPGVADDRYLVVVEKVAATPPKYPRKPGIPSGKSRRDTAQISAQARHPDETTVVTKRVDARIGARK